MLDVIFRALRHPIDYSGILRTTDLKLVEKIDEGNGVFSFILKAERLPPWKAGQHAIFTLPGKPVTGKRWRPFSIASAAHEGLIRIGTIIPPEPSSFKQHLLSLQPGDTIRMHGPYGELYIRPEMKYVVAVAGGIGITPFRAIIEDLAQQREGPQLTLIYSAKENHVWRHRLDKLASISRNLNIIYTHTAEEVATEISQQEERFGNKAHYFLSGAPKMIESLCQSLEVKSVHAERIIHDPFKGY